MQQEIQNYSLENALVQTDKLEELLANNTDIVVDLNDWYFCKIQPDKSCMQVYCAGGDQIQNKWQIFTSGLHKSARGILKLLINAMIHKEMVLYTNEEINKTTINLAGLELCGYTIKKHENTYTATNRYCKIIVDEQEIAGNDDKPVMFAGMLLALQSYGRGSLTAKTYNMVLELNELLQKQDSPFDNAYQDILQCMYDLCTIQDYNKYIGIEGIIRWYIDGKACIDTVANNLLISFLLADSLRQKMSSTLAKKCDIGEISPLRYSSEMGKIQIITTALAEACLGDEIQ